MSKSFVILISSIAMLAVLVAKSNAAETAPLLPDGCVCASTDELDPVCGNNGVTYPNLSTMRCADECVKYSIHLMHHGPCRT